MEGTVCGLPLIRVNVLWLMYVVFRRLFLSDWGLVFVLHQIENVVLVVFYIDVRNYRDRVKFLTIFFYL